MSIAYKVDSFKNITGYDLAQEKQINYLEKLGFEINKQKSFFQSQHHHGDMIFLTLMIL